MCKDATLIENGALSDFTPYMDRSRVLSAEGSNDTRLGRQGCESRWHAQTSTFAALAETTSVGGDPAPEWVSYVASVWSMHWNALALVLEPPAKTDFGLRCW